MPFFFPQQQQQQQQQRASIAQEQEMDLFQLLSLLSAASDEETPSKPQTQPQRQPQHCIRRSPNPHHQRQTQTPQSNPAFDILETATAYELFGEVPGLDISSLEVRFEDAQTLVLRGETVRGRPIGAAAVNEKKVVVVEEKKEVEKVEAEKEIEVEKKDKQASVEDSAEDEDEYDAVDAPLTASTANVKATTPVVEAKTTSPTSVTTSSTTTKPTPQPQPQPIVAKYWLVERKTGPFARSFTFAQRIEIDDVTAELHEGVLHVVVPKSVKSKKVAVSVR